ncbi:MAG: mechanosensitive ion channel domain-containing protein [Planctomycetota bacterium]
MNTLRNRFPTGIRHPGGETCRFPIAWPFKATGPRVAFLLVLACIAACMASPAFSQDPVAAMRGQVDASGLDDEAKKAALGKIAQAAKQREDAKAASDLAKQRLQQVETVDQRVAEVRRKLKKWSSMDLDDAALAPSLLENRANLEASLAEKNSELAKARKALEDSEANLKKSAKRQAEIDPELAKLAETLAERQQQLDAATAALAKSDEAAAVSAQANIEELSSNIELLKAREAALQAEKSLLAAEAAVNLPQWQRDLDAAQVKALEAEAKLLRGAIEADRRRSAVDQMKSAEEQLQSVHPVLRPMAIGNQELAELNVSLTGKIQAAELQAEQSREALDKIRKDYDKAKQRVETVGLTEAVGVLLRQMKRELPSISKYRTRIRERNEEINEANFKWLELNDQRNEEIQEVLDDLFAARRRGSSTDVPPIEPDQRERLMQAGREALQEQRTEFLDPATNNLKKYFNTLESISTLETQIIQSTSRLADYVNENVLWTRSTQPLYSSPLPSREELWFLQANRWASIPAAIWADIAGKSIVYWLMAGFVIVTLLLYRGRLGEEMEQIGKKVSGNAYLSMTPTLRTVLWTVAAAAPIPFAIAFVAWRLAAMAGADGTSIALASALNLFAGLYFPIELVRGVCRPNGLAEAHFSWPPATLRPIRQATLTLQGVAVPLVATATFLAAGTRGHARDHIERYFAIAAVTVAAIVVFRIAHPRRGMAAHYVANHPSGWISRLSSVWYPLLIAVPISLGLLSAIGYHFTSQQVAWRMNQTLVMVIALVLLVSVVMRWATIHRRRLRLEQAQRLREAEQEDGESAAVSSEDTPEGLREQMEQTRRMLRAAMVAFALLGFWFVWSDMIPALGMFEKWPLWNTVDLVTETITLDDGSLSVQSREVPGVVTIADAVLAGFIVLVTVAAIRNLPGLLEFAILSRLPLDRSVRYAITTLVTYGILMLGIILCGKTIGLHWNQIQWMATALTFGLAFGMQEMFANFIAGIIILFEQPIRVGDVVEIDGTTGVVSKIRIRATTITDWDRRDYIVPNKEFITGKLLNWTRSDDIVRVVIPIGIAYGSDTDLARELLLRAAAEHPDVLEEPRPLATFEGFGDNSLNFVLRVFITTYEKRLQIIHDLHMAIDAKYRRAGIEISFPQRDLNIRGLPKEMRHYLDRLTASSERLEKEQLT